jgi:hypothetical protein
MGLSWGISGPHPQEAWIQQFFTFERTFASWLCLLVILIGAFVAWFPIRMQTNVALYVGGFVVFFVSLAVEYFMLGHVRLSFSHRWSAIGMTGTLGAFVVWTVAMRKRREFTTTVIGHSWNPERMAELSRQLNEINTALSRFARQPRKISAQ